MTESLLCGCMTAARVLTRAGLEMGNKGEWGTCETDD